MGLKFATVKGSRLGFFSSGCTTACLRAAGTQPVDRMVLTNERRKGATESKTMGSLNRREGRQSEGQLDGCRCLTAADREDREAGSNRVRVAGRGRGGERGSGEVEATEGLSAAILLIMLKVVTEGRGGDDGGIIAGVYEGVQCVEKNLGFVTV